MKNLVIFTNCQGVGLVKMLFENSEFSSAYDFLRFRGVHLLTDKDIPEVVAKVEQADLFIYQPVSAIETRPIEFTSAFLLKKLKPTAQAISMPSIYFDGYFPHLKPLRGYISVLDGLHDYILAYSCAIGLSAEQTLELINKEDFYSQKLSVALAEQSLMELKRREEEFAIDITISEFIEQNYQKMRLFNQFNHPKRMVFKYLADCILSRCNMSSPFVSEIGEPPMVDIEPPIYRSTYKNLDLQFSEDFDTYRPVSQVGLTQQTVVTEFFNFYKQQDLEFIKTHVTRTKPFVPELVESHL
jgi:Polysaccharide biosynthesis enzyme WcbI